MTDPFFETIHDSEWNACVGGQGSALNYVDGYLEAARELIAAVIDKRLIGSRDTLAMPILYNCRHGLELALKFAIDRLHELGMIEAVHPISHDIQSHGSICATGRSVMRSSNSSFVTWGRSLLAWQTLIVTARSYVML